ncbi:PAS and ANTAR domain-containing protein [Promicromonospora sukumoe]|uniref:PAS and ANTAR domain-containing protein n=1 Tax=Promicromonospora sukumoe TaxID=88382 RepID=UPI003648D620
MPPFADPRVVDLSDAGGHDEPAPTAGQILGALGLGIELLVGRYSVHIPSGTWWWSDEVYAMHGWNVSEVEPGLESLRSRKHPEDRHRIVRTAGDALRRGKPFATGHRIVTATGETRSVLVTGRGGLRPQDRTAELAGYIVDATPALDEGVRRTTESTVQRAFVSQARIEQVKGLIMAVRGLDGAAAEQVLTAEARRAGISLRIAAEQVSSAVRADPGKSMSEAKLERALAAVHPVDRPRGHDALLTRRPRRRAS